MQHDAERKVRLPAYHQAATIAPATATTTITTTIMTTAFDHQPVKLQSSYNMVDLALTPISEGRSARVARHPRQRALAALDLDLERGAGLGRPALAHVAHLRVRQRQVRAHAQHAGAAAAAPRLGRARQLRR